MAIIVSAYPGCGKSYFYKKYSVYCKTKNTAILDLDNDISRTLKILDSDSSKFSWIYDENGKKTDERNPEFPRNYIQHIKDHLIKEDIIFISSHDNVRELLQKEEIPYILVYPERNARTEWINRFIKRGNPKDFVEFQEKMWDTFIDGMEDDPSPYKICLKGNEYLEDVGDKLLHFT